MLLTRSTKFFVIAFLLPILAACGKNTQESYNGVKIGKPYAVNGDWYAPKYQPYYDETGLASWYGPGFHGKKTSYGEDFDTNSLTAAHPTLPLPSFVEVTNLSNNKKVIVRINDRGPFAKNRIIDLSKAAAEKIDMLRTGTANVRVRYLKDDTERYIASKGGSLDGLSVAENAAGMGGATAQAAPVFSVASTSLPSSKPGSAFVKEAMADEDTASASPSSGMTSKELPPLPSATPGTGDTAARVASLSDSPGVQEAAALMPTQLPASMPIGRYPNDNPKDARARNGAIYVQVGAFSVEENAKKTANQLAIYGNAAVVPIELPGRKLYRVRLGPMDNRQVAQQSLEKVSEAGFKDAKIIQ